MYGFIKNGIKFASACVLFICLIGINALLVVLLYSRMISNEGANPFQGKEPLLSLTNTPSTSVPFAVEKEIRGISSNKPVKASTMLDAPLVLQNPELPSGCEITALTMLLQYYGIKKNKMELLHDMKTDPTPIQWGENGSILYWGNPNLGYVGDITGKKKGFGIYSAGLFPLLNSYIPTAVDLTRSSFGVLEAQIEQGFPVVVWTTITYQVPSEKQWTIWDSPLGLIQTTFQEHSVLLVGYDEEHVYVNDPLSGKKNVQVEKQQFIQTWEAMDKQALSYRASVPAQ
ncbi:C39 family peptidase [Paenibacillus alginolyticus]|uniref:C39 family peptidase n=1 Tax=Paenibacillus alginolyticus TaxID=59839 RepID=A0ABT4GB30_9BACL|nr:C39 family peptidase [Paenibacillus alginolyticus]MCY9693397.1 C39 family peptidase [Paenibacillus alginolyticus]MEC0144656.1 C39 family peptidase [Paenibacillus alginolyticus]